MISDQQAYLMLFLTLAAGPLPSPSRQRGVALRRFGFSDSEIQIIIDDANALGDDAGATQIVSGVGAHQLRCLGFGARGGVGAQEHVAESGCEEEREGGQARAEGVRFRHGVSQALQKLPSGESRIGVLRNCSDLKAAPTTRVVLFSGA